MTEMVSVQICRDLALTDTQFRRGEQAHAGTDFISL